MTLSCISYIFFTYKYAMSDLNEKLYNIRSREKIIELQFIIFETRSSAVTLTRSPLNNRLYIYYRVELAQVPSLYFSYPVIRTRIYDPSSTFLLAIKAFSILVSTPTKYTSREMLRSATIRLQVNRSRERCAIFVQHLMFFLSYCKLACYISTN